jgi:hypothetical protein
MEPSTMKKTPQYTVIADERSETASKWFRLSWTYGCFIIVIVKLNRIKTRAIWA